ncbi:MAG TPA: uroporphyrinogen decarboxylase family protein [bacterium]|nr:uroporphyrinogen decarboxylase family protein [bacterium]HPP29675.1 uroporphyrinogen decarboxylase family protein [bacterium]
MSGKERVLKAIRHEKTDRVPVDFWATKDAEKNLMVYLALDNREALLERLGVDIRYVFPEYAGPPLRTFPDGSREDIWKVRRKPVKTGNAIYNEVSYYPLAGANSIEDLEKFEWPDPEWFKFEDMKDICSRYEQYAIVLCDERTNRTTVLHQGIYLCGMEKIMMDLALNPEFVHTLFSRISDFYLKLNRRIFEAARGKIDILLIGDDMGTQSGLLISPAQIHSFILPYLKKYIKLCREYNVKVMFHSCGAIKEIIPDLIDAGFDILNPVQVRAAGMVPVELKKEFGEKICFHGGVDVQKTLPYGTVEDVRREVRERIDILGENGGYILAPTHNFQADIPVENIIAFYKEAGSINI